MWSVRPLRCMYTCVCGPVTIVEMLLSTSLVAAVGTRLLMLLLFSVALLSYLMQLRDSFYFLGYRPTGPSAWTYNMASTSRTRNMLSARTSVVLAIQEVE